MWFAGAGAVKNKPWYIQVIFVGGMLTTIAFLLLEPLAPKPDKAWMQLIAIAVFVAAFIVLSIYNRIALGTVLPGLKRSAAVQESSSSEIASKPKANRIVTAIGLLTIVLLSCAGAEVVRAKHLPVSTRIPFDLIMLGALVALIAMAFKFRQEQEKRQ
jgi:uncharacterized membrane protein (DUF485 family)